MVTYCNQLPYLHCIPPAAFKSDAEPLADTGAGFLDHRFELLTGGGFDPSMGMIAEALRVANPPLPGLVPERVS